MYNFQVYVLLMAVAFALVGVAQKLKIPYPLLLVVGGGALGFLPGLHVQLVDPNLILVIVLPPLLHFGAFWLSLRELKKYLKDILSLALGLVALTTLVVGCFFKWLFPELPWALAFAFGAIVSPPDAVSASTVLKRFHISPSVMSVLEGESLINDAFALIFYKFSVVALLTGGFQLADVGVEFVKIAAGGIALGAAICYIVQTALWRLSSPVVGVMFSFVLPYIVYITAAYLQVSGVLAVVTSGLMTSGFFVRRYDAFRRVLAVSTWSIFVIVLNCFVFILIGLQLKEIVQRASLDVMLHYSVYALLITALMFIVRLIWVSAKYAACYVRTCDDSLTTSLREGAIVAWCGMRGIISLACALALPLGMLGRDEVVFITFMVIFLTILIPGLSLPYLLEKLKVHHQHHVEHELITAIRLKLLELAHEVIDELQHLSDEERSFLKDYIHTRHKTREIQAATATDSLHPLEQARRTLLNKQRQFLLKLFEEGQIDEKQLKHLELELDFEEHLSIRPDSIIA